RSCYDVVRDHFENERSEPPHTMVLGTAGAGKSYLVYALSRLLGGFLRRAALTGMAGFLIAGSTLPSLPRLPVRQGRNRHGQSLKALQNSLTDVKYIITDELSMVSQSQMAWVDRRLRQGTAVDEPFGGISVIMTGDLGQLQPVGGTPLYKQNLSAALNIEGYAAYSLFQDIFILDGVQRQTAAAANDDDQRGFIELLPRTRDGQLCDEDWDLLLKRQPNRLTAAEKADFEDATRLFYSKKEVNKYNGKNLRELDNPVALVSAVHTGANARRASADNAEGLERDLFLAKGAKVMLSKNLYQQGGLVNGICEVVELVYADDAPPPKLPLYVVVKFERYSLGDWSSQERYRGCVLISPVDTTWQDGGTHVRTQLPLRLCWAIAMHKSLGQTLAKAVIDLGPKEACTGLTFVCLSRAKRLVDLVVEPMSFDRIGNLGNLTMKARLQGEVRLGELAQSTRDKYTDMGVFSAVAGNQ
ncbi:unnamed protein product, partial [Ectocarpus sp. 12 AP-2014]